MNKITQKKESNTKLLHILAKRDRNNSITHREEAWPGQKRPSFASTIKIKQHSQPIARYQSTERNKQTPLFTNNRLEMSRRNAKSLCAINTLSLKPSSGAKSMTDNLSLNKNQYKSYRSKKMKSSTSQSQSKNYQVDSDDYVIDYMAFNYIGKVIDTPQLWAKFVHKKLAI